VRKSVANFSALVLLVTVLTVLAVARVAVSLAAPAAINVTIKDHRFIPSEVHVKAGQRADLNIKNEDPLAEEFDSTALKIEKVIGGGQQGTVHLRPLDPGRYPFMGEYHPDTAQGVVIAQ
jgi:plastocyanin